jgi:K+-transporting ATPase ATPase C chain
MKTLIASIRFMIVMTLLTGFAYPLAMTGIAQVMFPDKANGSIVKNPSGAAIGSSFIAQKFTGTKYFWARPSGFDYNPMPSGGSNLAPISLDLLAKVKERKDQGLSDDLLFASSSGLDPQISPKGAYNQIARVAKARSVNEEVVRAMVAKSIEGRQFGFLGEERVNVLKLNLALDALNKKVE